MLKSILSILLALPWVGISFGAEAKPVKKSVNISVKTMPFEDMHTSGQWDVLK